MWRQESSALVGGCRQFVFTPTPDVAQPRRCVDAISSCPADADADLASACVRPSNVAHVYGLYDRAYRNRALSLIHI